MSQADHDPVNHPSHYTQGGVECIEAIEAALGPQGFIAFLRGQVIKYNWRLGKKDLPVQDAKKALWYGELLVSKLQEDVEEPHDRRQDDAPALCVQSGKKQSVCGCTYCGANKVNKNEVHAVPTTQGEALTEKKAQNHDNSNRNSNTFAADVARFYSCPRTGDSKRTCGCAICTQRRAPYRSQP